MREERGKKEKVTVGLVKQEFFLVWNFAGERFVVGEGNRRVEENR